MIFHPFDDRLLSLKWSVYRCDDIDGFGLILSKSMYIPTNIRRAIFKAFFEAGVLVVSSNQSGNHPELKCLNIYPFQIGRSFVSKGFANKQYAWSHAYYTLTDKGVTYLRDFFGLPATAVPKTLEPRNKDDILTQREPRFNRGPRRDFGDRPRRGRGGRGRMAQMQEEAAATAE